MGGLFHSDLCSLSPFTWLRRLRRKDGHRDDSEDFPVQAESFYSRYFVDNDGVEYRWKTHKGVGCVLTSVHDNREIAKYTTGSRIEGFFAGEKKTFLRIQPCSLDLDLLVLSFAVMEKKRRERAGDLAGLVPHEDDDALGDGAGDGGGEA
ncbi:hypothetical protein H2248_009958 [Termitomyces sp. 'cryptogamus']|nr:hypothetical protein H2248_009958 [Termitomyces sp. 'cryptogamus']